MKYAKLNTETNTIDVYRVLPREYNGINNYQNASEETHKQDGFWVLKEPEINSETEKLGKIKKVPYRKEYTYETEPLSQEELEQKQLATLKKFLDEKRSDGLEYFNQKELEITQQLIGIGQENLYPILDEVDNTLYKALNLIKTGDYASCLRYMTQATAPLIPMVLNIWNEMQDDIMEYYQTKYPR